MGNVFTSLVFKYKDELYLGFLNDENEIINFKNINHKTPEQYADLRSNEFLIVLVEQQVSTHVDFYDIEKVPIIVENETDPPLVIGAMGTAPLFELANQVLKDNRGKRTLH